MSRDLPVLITVARLLEADDIVQSSDVAAAVNLPERQVELALTNLSQRYLSVEDASSFDGRDVYVTGIRAAGLEAAGQWPTPETAADRLLAAISRLADAEPADSPRRPRLIAVRDGLLAAGRDVLVEVAGSVITGKIPL